MKEDKAIEVPRLEIFEPDSNDKFERSEHEQKQESEIVVIDEGSQIDLSDRQLANADVPKLETLEQDSNARYDRA
jgi:hypothetical protein